jgi:putative phage-type endonuclease
MNAIAMPVRQNTAEWEEARLDGIGSSDAPVIAGERGSVVQLWAVKSRKIEPPAVDDETLKMYELGHRLEPVIAAVYTEREGRPLRRVNRMLRRRDVAWACASLDRVSAVKGERRIVELKTAPWARWGDDEPVPGAIQAQVQHQLWVTGYDVADVAVLHRGYDLRVHTIERDDGFIEDLVYLEREFWRWVQTDTRPPVDGSDATRLALQAMFPDEYGEILPATPELEQLVDRLYVETALFNAAKNRLGSTKNAIRFLLGESAGAAGDGWKVSWRKAKDGTETDWQLVAQNQRKLLEAVAHAFEGETLRLVAAPDLVLPDGEITLGELLDTIESLHTKTKQGKRSLRPWWKDRKAVEEEPEEAAA